MKDHPNVELARRGFAALAAGDVEIGSSLFAPDLTYFGGDQFGRFRKFGSRDEFLGMVMEVMALNDEFSNDLVDAYAVGDSLVIAHFRAHRRSRASGEVLDTDYVMVLRIEDGAVTHGVDLIDGDAAAYFGRLANL